MTHVNSTNSVHRRYKDFVRLHKTLKWHCPGAFIPPLPQKKLIGRFENAFIASRTRGLQHFMEEVLKSPDFQNLDYVVAFWEENDAQKWISLASQCECECECE